MAGSKHFLNLITRSEQATTYALVDACAVDFELVTTLLHYSDGPR